MIWKYDACVRTVLDFLTLLQKSTTGAVEEPSVGAIFWKGYYSWAPAVLPL